MTAKNQASIMRASDKEELPEQFYLHDPTLGKQFGLLWSKKWLILAAVLVSAAATYGTSFLVTPEYEASILLIPVSSGPSSGSMISRLGALAGLAGLASADNGKRAEKIAFLQSRLLLSTYIRKNDLLPILYKGYANSAATASKQSPLDSVPTVWKAVGYFRKRVLRVSQNTDGLVNMIITWRDPAEAAQWANGLVAMTNSYFRDKAVAEHKRNIAYLQAAATQVTAIEVKQGIYSLLTQEVKDEMLAEGTLQFAFQVIDPAISPELPSSPKKFVWLLVGAMFGFIVSAGVILIKNPPASSSDLR